jgi:SAM-dependent methyltransferase
MRSTINKSTIYNRNCDYGADAGRYAHEAAVGHHGGRNAMSVEDSDRPVLVDGLTVTDRFTRAFDPATRRETGRRLRRAVFGDEYPEEADPNSFVTLTELRRLARELRVGAGQTIADLGCGRGGPGLWVARETGASLVGVDLVPAAIEAASRRVDAFGLGGRAAFRVGEFAATGLPDAACDAAMSVDALGFVADKAAALREVARIVRVGGRFVFTAWEYRRPVASGLTAPQVADFRPLLEAAGLAVAAYEPTLGGARLERAMYEAILAAEDELLAEMGEAAGRPVIDEARNRLPVVDQRRRILAVARKR